MTNANATNATTAKERPIIFSGPMLNAILEGRKCQTRRIVKPQPVDGDTIVHDTFGEVVEPGRFLVGRMRDSENAWRELPCPYGRPGDVLWVRETWSPDHRNVYPCWQCVYKAEPLSDEFKRELTGFRWHSPIHMPRHFSRLTLRITEVRVQRLAEMTAEDARAEGVDAVSVGIKSLNGQPASGMIFDPRMKFRALWDSIHGDGAWAANLFVWAITFERIAQENNYV